MTAAHWWQPSNPKKALPGVLLEDEERGWLLQLDGSFQELDLSVLASAGQPVAVQMELPDSFPILVGTTSQGQLVSLVNCQVLEGSYPFPGSRGSLKLWPTTLVYGVHFESADDFRLTSLSIHYSHLDTWTATSGFSVTFGPAFYPVEVRYAKPESVEGVLPDGLKISVDFSASGPSLPAITDVRITQRSWLTITSEHALPYQQLLRHTGSFADLISLCVGEPLRRVEMSATCNAQDPLGAEVTTRISVIDNLAPIAAADRDVPARDMLFTLPDICTRFGELVVAWFSRDATLQSLYDLYFGTMRSSSMYVEHRFLNMFQALESYDRRTFEPTPEKMQAHQERLKRILNAVSAEKDRKWLTQQLKHSHEPAAADRIRRLVDRLDASWLLSNEDITLAANLRNYYTHFDSKIEQNLPPIERRFLIMHDLAVRLRVLCELVLLDAMGFSKDDVRERMRRTRRVERHLVEPASGSQA
jgi:hypothetical protein